MQVKTPICKWRTIYLSPLLGVILKSIAAWMQLLVNTGFIRFEVRFSGWSKSHLWGTCVSRHIHELPFQLVAQIMMCLPLSFLVHACLDCKYHLMSLFFCWVVNIHQCSAGTQTVWCTVLSIVVSSLSLWNNESKQRERECKRHQILCILCCY